MAVVLKQHGALRCVKSWGNDVPEGKLTSFTMAVKCAAGGAVVFYWTEWPSRPVRDAAWEKAMANPRMNPANSPLPFDGKRMTCAGFQIIMQA